MSNQKGSLLKYFKKKTTPCEKEDDPSSPKRVCVEPGANDVVERSDVTPNPPPGPANYAESSKISLVALPTQVFESRTLRFQPQWTEKYPWILPQPIGVLCRVCVDVYENKKNKLNMNFDKAFVSAGYTNWKHALENFRRHSESQSHTFAVAHHVQVNRSECIEGQLSSQVRVEQEKARSCFSKIIGALQFCARQGLAIRGHDETEGNFRQLLKILEADDPELREWLKRKINWCSPKVQNEILSIMSNSILREIVRDALASGAYSVIVDGTIDVSGTDQYSVCLRFVDPELKPREEFLGMYAMISTTGEIIANMIEDVLCRLQLPLHLLRGQTYDGAANMSGKYKGAQAVIKTKQPLALYVHCTAHATNLVASHVATRCQIVSRAMDAVNELGVLLSNSANFRVVLKDVLTASNTPSAAINPLCPTRWLTRVRPIVATLSQYVEVLSALENSKRTNPTASGLLERFNKGETLLGMIMAVRIFSPLEILNKALQGRQQTISGAREAVTHAKHTLADLRSDKTFEKLYAEMTSLVDKYDLEPVTLPRKRRPPARLTGDGEPFHHDDAREHYKVQLYEMIDTAIAQLDLRFFQPGMETYRQLEEILLDGDIDQTDSRTALLGDYTEFDVRLLKIQLQSFRAQHVYSSLPEAVEEFSKMKPEVKRYFSEVERLVRLLLTIPASSCEAERSFSALRRLKTYLRNTTSQQRLNSVCVCHVHKDLLDGLRREDILRQFVQADESRVANFGRIRP